MNHKVPTNCGKRCNDAVPEIVASHNPRVDALCINPGRAPDIPEELEKMTDEYMV
jgi:hypothetical protein